jgi:hypothetical protein
VSSKHCSFKPPAWSVVADLQPLHDKTHYHSMCMSWHDAGAAQVTSHIAGQAYLGKPCTPQGAPPLEECRGPLS